MMTKLLFLIAASIIAATFTFNGPIEDPSSVEIGTVNWGRDYDAAKKTSADSGKPILLLFQEVPG